VPDSGAGFGTGRRDAVIVGSVLAWIPVVLWLDRLATMTEQRWLGVGTGLLLVLLLVGEPVRIRAQVAVVVGFATLIEYVFSYQLHVYVYRLHDVPWFVPPGHGLVYLGALAIGRSPAVRSQQRWLIPLTLAGGASYAGWGLLLSGRRDVLGAFWFGCLVLFLFRARQPLVFVGAFIVVTYLELLGTHLGAWTWQVKDPIAHLVSMGNPPSGAAGGYGFFDAAALALAPRIERALRRRPPGGGGARDAEDLEQLVMELPVAGQHVASVGALDS
jgi:hypothetical protein